MKVRGTEVTSGMYKNHLCTEYFHESRTGCLGLHHYRRRKDGVTNERISLLSSLLIKMPDWFYIERKNSMTLTFDFSTSSIRKYISFTLESMY